jgi:hypothetical protein
MPVGQQRGQAGRGRERQRQVILVHQRVQLLVAGLALRQAPHQRPHVAQPAAAALHARQVQRLRARMRQIRLLVMHSFRLA